MNKQELIALLNAATNDSASEWLGISGQAFNNGLEIAVMYAKQLDESQTKPCEFCAETHYFWGMVERYGDMTLIHDVRYDAENKQLDLMVKDGGCVITERSINLTYCPNCGRKL